MPYKDKAQALAYARLWRKAHPEYHKAKWDALRKEKPGIQRAAKVTYRDLLSGRTQRPDFCEECRAVGAVEAAHFSYSSQRSFRWLCHSCHVKWDKAEPKF